MARAVSVGGTRLRPFWPAEGVRGAGAVPAFGLRAFPAVARQRFDLLREELARNCEPYRDSMRVPSLEDESR